MTERYVRVLKEADSDPLAELGRLIGQTSELVYGEDARNVRERFDAAACHYRPNAVDDAIFYAGSALIAYEQEITAMVRSRAEARLSVNPARDAFYYRPHVHAFHIAKL